MEIKDLKDYKRGWVIGDFLPSILRTKDFEVGLLEHKKGEFWPAHVHNIVTEYNILIEGRLTINSIEILPYQIFIIPPGEPTKAIFLEDCKIIVIKTPSIPKDKYEINYTG